MKGRFRFKFFCLRCCTGSPWQIIDWRRISKDVFEDQLRDGYHVRGEEAFSSQEVKEMRENAIMQNMSLPGELEIQLTQSFLNAIFYDSLVEYFI